MGVHAGVPLQGGPPSMLHTPQMLQPASDARISWDAPDPWDALIPRDDPSLLGCTNPPGYSDPLGCSRPPGCSALPRDAPAPLTLGQDPAPVGTPLYPAQSWAVPGCDGVRGPCQDRIPSPPHLRIPLALGSPILQPGGQDLARPGPSTHGQPWVVLPFAVRAPRVTHGHLPPVHGAAGVQDLILGCSSGSRSHPCVGRDPPPAPSRARLCPSPSHRGCGSAGPLMSNLLPGINAALSFRPDLMASSRAAAFNAREIPGCSTAGTRQRCVSCQNWGEKLQNLSSVPHSTPGHG